MIKDVVDKQFKVVKDYAGATASIYYSSAADAYILKVESTDEISEGFVHRCCLDLGVEILNTRITLKKERQCYVNFLEG